MKPKFLAGLAAGVLLCGMTQVATASVIVNGDFETGLAGWTTFLGTASVMLDGDASSNVASMPGGGVIGQSISWVAGDKLTLKYKDVSPVSNPAGLAFQISFDGGGMYISGLPTNGSSAWKSYTYTFTGADSGMLYLGNAGVTASESRFDNVSITSAVPEPSSAMLIGFGALSLLGFRRSRKACVKS